MRNSSSSGRRSQIRAKERRRRGGGGGGRRPCSFSLSPSLELISLPSIYCSAKKRKTEEEEGLAFTDEKGKEGLRRRLLQLIGVAWSDPVPGSSHKSGGKRGLLLLLFLLRTSVLVLITRLSSLPFPVVVALRPPTTLKKKKRKEKKEGGGGKRGNHLSRFPTHTTEKPEKPRRRSCSSSSSSLPPPAIPPCNVRTAEAVIGISGPSVRPRGERKKKGLIAAAALWRWRKRIKHFSCFVSVGERIERKPIVRQGRCQHGQQHGVRHTGELVIP